MDTKANELPSFGSAQTASILNQLNKTNEIFAPKNIPAGVVTVSNEMRRLLVNYCAKCLSAFELAEIDFTELGLRLGARPNHLREAAITIDKYIDPQTGMERTGVFWAEVMELRIKSLNASRAFRDVSWERLESQTLHKLTELADAGLIRDPGELLAMAMAARKVNMHESQAPQQPGGNHVSISFNNGSESLPAAGSTMTIDLNPRIAASLATKAERPAGERVIDGQMLSAQELRDALAAQQSPVIETVGDSNE